MRHVNEADLDQLEPLLAQLRALDGLRERKRGNFTRNSRSFLHLHAHDDEFFADVRLKDEFERFPVTTRAQHRELVKAIESRLRSQST